MYFYFKAPRLPLCNPSFMLCPLFGIPHNSFSAIQILFGHQGPAWTLLPATDLESREVKSMCFYTLIGSSLRSVFSDKYSCETSSKLLHPLVRLYLHLYNGSSNSSSLIGWIWGLKSNGYHLLTFLTSYHTAVIIPSASYE